jgi:hypothetical protein
MNVNGHVVLTISAVALEALSEPLEALDKGCSPPGGGEGWPDTGHRKSQSTSWILSLDPRDETKGPCEFYFLIDSAATTMSLGSMAMGVSREWMCTPANPKSTHGFLKRMRGDGVTSFYHRFSR